MGEREDILLATTPGFQRLHREIGQRIRNVFPDAAPVTAWGMAAWGVKVPDPPPKESWKGTLPHDVLVLGPTQKKAGITIHVWHPNDPRLLAKHEAWLTAAGFKVMVGCLQWNRKADLPMDAVDRLLQAAKQAMA